jgi:MFS family permease
MFLINVFSYNFLFLLCLGISLSSLFLTTRLRKRPIESVENSSKQDEPFLSREAIPSAIMAFLAHMIWGALTAFFPLYAIQNGVANPGFFFAAYAIVLILGRALGAKILDLYSRERIILPCLTTYIISMMVLAYSKTLPMFILAAVIWGSGNAFLMPTLVAYALDRAVSSPGTVMGTYTAICDLGVALGPVIMGIILRFTSYPTMFLCLALLGVTNLTYFYFFVRKRESEG